MPLEAVYLHQYSTTSKKWEPYVPGHLETVVPLPVDLHLLTWHVGCVMEYPASRMFGILDFVKSWGTQPHIVLFQEVDTRAHNILLTNEYVQKTFNVNFVDDSHFERPGGSSWGYGNLILVKRDFLHLNCLYLRYDNTQMGSNAVMIDFKHPAGNYIRFISTQLECGSNEDAKTRRTAQLAALVEISNDPTLRASVMCTYTAPEHADAPGGFGDVFVNVGGVAERNPTWGMNEDPPVAGERRTKVFVKGTVGTLNAADYARVGGGERIRVTGLVEGLKIKMI
ncbi:hypothetical protein BJ508DRAFT_304171 [Ascobolus immersus RN42]|uniref:Endonuclease/exonuclease/phosphatase domain-containing protein n=1 Tax=Ascobolus immersus RN42 TaxID=1160509 RepID=A0A3N4IEW9_ASCIM|nr:hypothetical protein BJ508DRAFT_304171 [Ascobolus immersus RN42]